MKPNKPEPELSLESEPELGEIFAQPGTTRDANITRQIMRGFNFFVGFAFMFLYFKNKLSLSHNRFGCLSYICLIYSQKLMT